MSNLVVRFVFFFFFFFFFFHIYLCNRCNYYRPEEKILIRFKDNWLACNYVIY